jgi:flagellar basal body rod protein FlgG
MIKGLYSAASAMLARVNQQNVLAHNVDNMDTPGFRQVLLALDDFTRTSTLGASPGASTGRYLGDLGLGVQTLAEEIDFTEGGLQFTGQPLDLAIQGQGFFRIRTPQGERYTRDGRFDRDAQGQLVTIDGYLVLSADGQPIVLDGEGEVTVGGDGTLFQDGQSAGRLGLVAFANPESELARSLPNLFSAAGAPSGEQLGVVSQGYLEASNVNPAQIMAQMTLIARNYEAAQQMVQNQDELLGRAINTLGRL